MTLFPFLHDWIKSPMQCVGYRAYPLKDELSLWELNASGPANGRQTVDGGGFAPFPTDRRLLLSLGWDACARPLSHLNIVLAFSDFCFFWDGRIPPVIRVQESIRFDGMGGFVTDISDPL